jgi:pseudouridine-5'-monophosphatase
MTIFPQKNPPESPSRLLLNTEDKYTDAHQIIAEKYGASYPWSIKKQVMGMQALPACEIILKLQGIPPEVCTGEELLKQREELLEPLFKQSEWLEGTKELLESLQNGGEDGKDIPITALANPIPFFLATSSPRDQQQIKITKVRAEFEKLFGNRTICGDEIPKGRGKPRPDIFQIALRTLLAGENVSIEDIVKMDSDKLGGAVKLDSASDAWGNNSVVEPSEVFVFEDSPSGVRAGKAGEFTTVMVPHEQLDLVDSLDADIVVSSLRYFDTGQYCKAW